MAALWVRVRMVGVVVSVVVASVVAIPAVAQEPDGAGDPVVAADETSPAAVATTEDSGDAKGPEPAGDTGEGVGVRVSEVVEARTLRSKTFLLDTGQFETEVATTEVHYADAEGRLVDLDASMEWADAVAGWVPLASPHDIAIAEQSDAGASFDGVTFTLADAQSVIGVPDDDGRVVYPGVFDGVDWRVWSHPGGMGEDLVIASPDAAAGLGGRVDYTVDGDDGMAWSAGPAGTVLVGEGDDALVVGAPFARDAAGVEADATWEITDAGLAMMLPAEWLADEARVWPVTVDPDVAPDILPTQLQDTYLRLRRQRLPRRDRRPRRQHHPPGLRPPRPCGRCRP